MPSLALTRSCTALRVGLAAGRLHHLADEPAGQRRLGLGLGDLVGVGRDHLVDGLFDGAGVGDLFHAALFDHVRRIATLFPDDFEQVLGDLAGMVVPSLIRSITPPSWTGKPESLQCLAGFVQGTQQVVDDPVGGRLAVAPGGDFLEIVGDRLLGHKDRRVIDAQAHVGDKARLLVVGQFGQMSGEFSTKASSNSSGSRSGSGK
jgi:hypothetical protein